MSWTAPLAMGACAFVLGTVAIVADSDVRLAGDHQGYAPEQPIHFSHRIHAGELGIDCRFCHTGAESSRHAGVPPTSTCMGCHAHVTSGFDAVLEERAKAKAEGREPVRVVSTELRKLYDAVGLDENLEPVPDRAPNPVEWVRVHNVPDHVYFDHRVHVARGLACEQCHGPVASMERIRQHETLSMGWCIDCHRESPRTTGSVEEGAPHVSIDCARCHY